MITRLDRVSRTDRTSSGTRHSSMLSQYKYRVGRVLAQSSVTTYNLVGAILPISGTETSARNDWAERVIDQRGLSSPLLLPHPRQTLRLCKHDSRCCCLRGERAQCWLPGTDDELPQSIQEQLFNEGQLQLGKFRSGFPPKTFWAFLEGSEVDLDECEAVQNVRAIR